MRAVPSSCTQPCQQSQSDPTVIRNSADSPWFEHVARDIGLVEVSSRRRLAVLAATDTD
ncbi:DUF6183 family protein [Streptomyces sp. MS1.AVA.1]|uniref:DUF6183 family protein n=1 Tax=Streptomyces machairae TaxID=3134109 RepID=A0ABU8UFX8_9ACTN